MAHLSRVEYAGQQALRRMHGNSTLERLTRAGFVAKGVVYLLVGVLALMTALGEGGETTDTKGAIARIFAQPFGEFLVTLVAVGLAAYALWRLLCAFTDAEHAGSDRKGIVKRIGYLASGLAYGGAAIYAFKLVAGENASRADQTRTWSARLMEAPAGELLLACLGIIIIAVGVFQIRHGWQERFREHLRVGRIPGQHVHWAIRAGKWGYIARGIVFGVIGAFVVLAAMRHDPSRARGLEGALDTLASQPNGQWLLGFVAAGLACYGVYCLVEARYRRVNT